MSNALSAWQFWAALAALFAALTAIFAKVGVENINADLATFIRTLIVIVLLVNYLTFRHYDRLDWTSQGMFTLSDKSKKVLAGLKDDLELYLFLSRGEESFQATDELVGDRGERAPVGDLALDALGHDLVVAGHVGLEVAVLGEGLFAPGGHRAERAHAAVGLELLAVDEDRLAG